MGLVTKVADIIPLQLEKIKTISEFPKRGEFGIPRNTYVA
jgi:hypothetical protein